MQGPGERCPQCGAEFGDVGSLVAHVDTFHSQVSCCRCSAVWWMMSVVQVLNTAAGLLRSACSTMLHLKAMWRCEDRKRIIVKLLVDGGCAHVVLSPPSAVTETNVRYYGV